mmetsp:Transcript_95898/g.173036  ORF Transcript_95898/g.173036 Transcript_95898/m.173036 type:complete len:819 (+) Transcript_95898:108-2564(+)
MVSSEGDRLSGDMEDDSWADGPVKPHRWNSDIRPPPPIRRLLVLLRSDFLKDHAIHDPSILEDDSWADDLRKDGCRYRRNVLYTRPSGQNHLLEEPFQAEDAWADALPQRLGESGLLLAAPSWPQLALAPPGAELEDDSWADAIVPGRRCTSVREVSASAAGEQATPSATGLVLEASTAQTTSSTSALDAVSGSVQNSGHGVPGSRNALQPPDVPLEYSTFAGRVVEVHANDASAGEIFAEVFAMSRFRAEFPAAEGLPLLVGLDFEWKPDRKPADNNPIALIQIACWDTAFIVRTTGCAELPTWLRAFLETGDEVVKATASFDVSDKQKLQTSFGWDFDANAVPSSFVDIAELARERDIPYGMARMATFFELPMQKLKVIGSSNWAREAGLTSQQKEYAADDAFFQLFLLGKLLDHRPPEDSNTSLQKMLQQFRITREAMEKVLKRVDNSAYRKNFFQLRDVVRDATDLLSKALGSGGCTNINDLNRLKVIQKFMEATARTCPIHVSANFLKQNMDIFVVFFREGQLRVRLRLPEDGDEELEDPSAGDQVAPDMSAEDAAKLVAEVQELLAKYEPPVEKRRTVMHRNVPEPFWVPARAILTRQRIALLEACLADGVDSLESSFDGEDGVLLRLTRHPRAPDDADYLEKCACALSTELQIELEVAKKRLTSDEKFIQFWALLRTIEEGSKEETSISRCLKARGRILADAHRLAARISPGAPDWDAAKEGLEKVKWYRQLLGDCLGNQGGSPEIEAKVQNCLDCVFAAWPDVKNVTSTNSRKRPADAPGEPGSKSESEPKRARADVKGKGKGKVKTKKG